MSGNGQRPRLILASSSPRRLDLLRQVGVTPTVVAADIDESVAPGEKAVELVDRLARQKAATAWNRLDESSGEAPLVLAADTVIEFDAEIMGKPGDEADAARMLRTLSGNRHDVVTGVACKTARGGQPVVQVECEQTSVWFRSLSQSEIDWYVETGEPMGKAGAYGIQGLGSLLVDRIEGSYHNIVGLPLTTVDRMVGRWGWPLRELGGTS